MSKQLKIWELPYLAQIILEVQLEGKQPEDMILTYHGIDGAYGKWKTPCGKIINFNGKFIKNGKFYKLI